MDEKALELTDVGIKFNLSKEKTDSLKEYVIKLLKRELMYDEFWALRHVSFSLEKGDRLGILGMNGAGKSTLLKIIAGVYQPNEGTVMHSGVIAPLLELGAGFDPQYTGAENIFLYGSILGYSKQYLTEKFEEIVSFSELKDFINVPLKNYSSGMRARLGFAIATIADPEILILDEVLSVGDARFRKKSERKIMEMFERGVTVLFVSHSLEQVQRLCNKAILLQKGQLVAQGDTQTVAQLYQDMLQ